MTFGRRGAGPPDKYRDRRLKSTGSGPVAVGRNIEDVHAAAALAADGDGDGKDAGEQVGPADAVRSGGGLGSGAPRVVIVIVEGQGELLRNLDVPPSIGGAQASTNSSASASASLRGAHDLELQQAPGGRGGSPRTALEPAPPRVCRVTVTTVAPAAREGQRRGLEDGRAGRSGPSMVKV